MRLFCVATAVFRRRNKKKRRWEEHWQYESVRQTIRPKEKERNTITEKISKVKLTFELNYFWAKSEFECHFLTYKNGTRKTTYLSWFKNKWVQKPNWILNKRIQLHAARKYTVNLKPIRKNHCNCNTKRFELWIWEQKRKRMYMSLCVCVFFFCIQFIHFFYFSMGRDVSIHRTEYTLRKSEAHFFSIFALSAIILKLFFHFANSMPHNIFFCRNFINYLYYKIWKYFLFSSRRRHRHRLCSLSMYWYAARIINQK